jgi:hypothetical protein
VTRALLGVAALLALAGEAAAQADTTARDTTARRDTTATRDTVGRDTMPLYLPVFTAPRPEGPLPRGTRFSFTADSFVLSNVQTLSDLLAHIPGVYVARGGIYGQAEIVFYGGRGAAGLEIYWDGVPYVPLGRDSVFLDPARISLAPLERVDVVVLPAGLRVYLVTARQRSTETATQVGVATGEANTSNYRGSYARRWRRGLGLALLADYNHNNGFESSSSTGFNSVDLWLKAEYVPNAKLGASYHLLSSTWSRNPETATKRTDRFDYERRTGIFRGFVAQRGDGLGPRLELTFATTRASRDTAVPPRSLTQGAIAATQGWRRGHVGVALRLQGSERPWQVEGSAAWRLFRTFTLAADGRRARYDNSRIGDRVHLAAEIALPLGFSLHGDVAWADDLHAPALATDTGQRTLDFSGALRWERSWAMLEVGGGRRDAFDPMGRAAGLKPIGRVGPTQRTRYVTVHGALRPVPGLHFAGWFFDPLVQGGNDFEPPFHGRLSATFYSKFWRVYRSGIFAFRVEAAMESWSTGTAGLDTLGNVLALPGAMFIETNVDVRIAGVTIFWIQRNTSLTRGSYVPGLDYPRRFQFYGVRWLFTN